MTIKHQASLCCLVQEVIFCKYCGKRYCMPCFGKEETAVLEGDTSTAFCKTSTSAVWVGPKKISIHCYCTTKLDMDKDVVPPGVWISSGDLSYD